MKKTKKETDDIKATVLKRGGVVARLVREDCAGKHYSVCLGYEDEVSGVWLACSTRENAKNLLKAIKKYVMD
jgi:hypothetical protein